MLDDDDELLAAAARLAANNANGTDGDDGRLMVKTTAGTALKLPERDAGFDPPDSVIVDAGDGGDAEADARSWDKAIGARTGVASVTETDMGP